MNSNSPALSGKKNILLPNALYIKAPAKLAKSYDEAYQESEHLFNSLVQRAFKGEL